MKWLWRVLVVAVVAWAVRPAVVHVLRDEVDLALDQLAGQGCQIQEGGVWTSNPIAEFSTRSPDYRCRMFAAGYLSRIRSGARHNQIQYGFVQALTAKSAIFDTGDGVIQYRATIQAAMDMFRSGAARE